MLELEALQQSSSKLNEDRIFELKQRIEDLLMENDTLTVQGQTLKREVSSLRYFSWCRVNRDCAYPGPVEAN